jgi:hypothetical protein
LLFDHQPEQGFLSHKLIHSEPVSPSSVATTPTTSEHPVVAPSRQTSSQYAADYEDAQVSHIHVSKKLRKSTPSTSHASVERSSGDRNGRKKKYDAPPGVWRNSGGFISTVYINKNIKLQKLFGKVQLHKTPGLDKHYDITWIRFWQE